LDNIDEIKKIDQSNMLSFCVQAPEQYGNAAKLASQFKISYPKPEAIIVAGMGGSAIGGELLKDWARDRVTVPIDVCREYHLPAYANKNTLVVATSYSGETEETLSVFLEALRRRCMVTCISSGGAMTEFAEKLSIPHLVVPGGMPPRATLPYLFLPLLGILMKMGLAREVDTEFSENIRVLKQVSSENSPERPLCDNLSKKLASKVNGTVPTVYGFGFYRAVAQRLKTQFNENSKNPAKWESFPELNHNEIVGWEQARELAKCFSVIFIRDAEEPKEIRERIEFTKEIINKGAGKLFELWSSGKSSLTRMSSVICVGDFTSVYLAVVRGIDPTPVRTIASLKERLKKTRVKEKTVLELLKLAKK
jgi:glucose/mannose-6-phosphate isomerase